MKITRFSRLAPILSALLLFSYSLNAYAIPATWTAGNSNWNNAANWDIPAVPCNTGSATFEVTIPNGVTVSHDVPAPPPCEINQLTLNNSTLTIESGADLGVLGQADIYGVINGIGGDFTAALASFPGTAARAYASNGSSVTIGATSYSSAGLVGGGTLFSSTGANSTLNLSVLSDLNASFDDGCCAGTRVQMIVASDSGMLDLSGVHVLTGPARLEDRLDINVSTGGDIDLSSLQTVTSGGAVRFNISAGALPLELPAIQAVDEAVFEVSGGATLIASGSPWNYSSTGFVGGGSLMSVTGTGSTLNLSGMQDLNAAFDDGCCAGTRVQTITASDGGMLDLSGVQTLTGPVRFLEDRLDINLSTGGNIDLSSLQTISGSWVRFNVPGAGDLLDLSSLANVSLGGFTVDGGGTLDLPSLDTVQAVFSVNGGATLTATGSPWNYLSTGLTGGGTLMNVAGVGSTLNLSSMQNLNASFDDGCCAGTRVQMIVASDSGMLDLSGVHVLTGPARLEDRLDINVSTGGDIDLSSLHTVSGGGQLNVNITENGLLNISPLKNISGGGAKLINIGSATMPGGGELQIGELSNVQGGIVTINLNESLSSLVVPDSLLISPPVKIVAVDASHINIGQDYSFIHTNEADLALASAIVQFNGIAAQPQMLEVGGFDINVLTPADDNFGFGQLIVGQDAQAPEVHLRDDIDNGNGFNVCTTSSEALYLFGTSTDPNGLYIKGGSTLYLNGIPVYAMESGVLVSINAKLGASDMIGYDQGFIARGVEGDVDNDGVVNSLDNCATVANPDQRDTDGDGYGNVCDADLNNDNIVNTLDFGLFKQAFGSVATQVPSELDCDFNGDGRCNTLDFGYLKKLFGKAPGPSCQVP